MFDIPISKVLEAIAAYPEASIAIFGGGLVVGWGAAWLLANREIRIHRTVIDGLKEKSLSAARKKELLDSASSRNRFWPVLKSSGILIAAAMTAAIVVYFSVPKTPPPWQITAEQTQKLKDGLANEPEKFTVPISVVPGSPSDAVTAGYGLMDTFNSVNGWNAIVIPFDAYHSPREIGLQVSYKTGTDPEKNEHAKKLKEILENAGFTVKYIADLRIPDNGTGIVVGKHP